LTDDRTVSETGVDEHMRAALLAEIKQPFVVEDIDYHDPTPGRVLVKTGASPFCSTDVVNWRGELFKIPPTVLGHASMGEVVEVGKDVTHLKVGDRVIVPGTSECGVCFYCSIGRPDQCSETFDRGGIWPHVADRKNGQPVSAAGNVGGYAEVMNVTATQVFPIESDLPDEVLGCMGCGITTGLGAVFNVARVQPGTSVAVVGLGHLGQWIVQAAKVAAARTIIAVDPIAYRRELAGTLGATDLVDPEADDPVAQVQALTEGRGADYVFEAATVTSAVPQAILMSRRAGTVVLSSVASGTATVTVPQVAIAVQSRAIISTQNGNVRMRADLPRFARLIEDGLIDAAPIVTTRYALDDINDALHASAEKRDLSGVIIPSLKETERLAPPVEVGATV
jgi:S-(hydroxymethyl)glutathione dehydrogenase / alcohol dehydrogenase